MSSIALSVSARGHAHRPIFKWSPCALVFGDGIHPCLPCLNNNVNNNKTYVHCWPSVGHIAFGEILICAVAMCMVGMELSLEKRYGAFDVTKGS